jgi:biopolymer transport protein ExbB
MAVRVLCPRQAVFLGAMLATAVTGAAWAQAQAPAAPPVAAPPASILTPAPTATVPAPPPPEPAPAPQPDAAQATGAEPATPPPAAANNASSMPASTPVVAAAVLPRDLSPWGMFLNADIVVKLVMIGLIFASLVTWTVWLAKNWELWRASKNARAALHVLNESRSLSEANSRLGARAEAVPRLLRTAVQEVQLSADCDPDGLKERVAWLLERVEAGVSRRIGRGMGLLASIGATAPFVGLFGTVWGIMNSFIGISNAHTTNLAVVAPGIAEALLATALGLFAAIPAVVIYNVFSRQIGGYRALLADGSALVMRLVSRDLDRVSGPISRAAE